MSTPERALPAIEPLDPARARPPVAAPRPLRTAIHGAERVDEYAWLRDRDDPEAIAYLEAENAYADAVLAPAAGLRDALYAEMLSHVKETDLSVPFRRGEWFWYGRTEEGLQYPIYARKRGSLDAPEEITLDLNALAADRAFLGLGEYAPSDDGALLAYSIDVTGYRQYELRVRDLRTGLDLAERIERVTSLAWRRDAHAFYYTTEDAVTKRNDTLHHRVVGETASRTLYVEPDELYDIACDRSRDRAYVFVGSYSKSTTEWRAIRADAEPAEPAVIVPRVEGHRCSVEHHGDAFLIVTNRDADDFRLVRADESDPQGPWRELVPQRPGVHLDDLDVFERHGVLAGRSGGFDNLEILDMATFALRPVALPEPVHGVFAQSNPEFATDAFRFAYSSLVTPSTVFELDLATGALATLKTTEVPGYDASLYASELLHATAADGTRVPVSLVARRDAPRDGGAPLLLYGYGSYGLSMDPTFSPSRLALLDRGVVFAIAHVRGGGELGEAWRTAGHLQRKLTTFEDFIACAETLVAQRRTSSDRLAIQGGSAGGLLVNAVANMRPDLFRAVLSQVPFVDVVNTMLDASLPLTTSEYLEWGDPRVEADYAYMLRYSPYDNVRAAAYPAMLVKVGFNDSQVPYWEGAKLVARLRATRTNAAPLLLRTNFDAGHGGASGRYDHLRDVASDYAFVLSEIAAGGGAPA